MVFLVVSWMNTLSRSEHVRPLAFVSRSEVVNLLTICLVSLLYLSCRLNVIRCFALMILFKSSYFFSVAPSPSLRTYLPCVSWWLLVFPFLFADFLSSYWTVTSLATQTLSCVYTCSFCKAVFYLLEFTVPPYYCLR